MVDDLNKKIREMLEPIMIASQEGINKAIFESISDLQDRVKKLEERVDWIVDQSVF